MTKAERPTFIEKHGLWSDEQGRLAAEIARRVETEKLHFVRLAWGDTHGYSRAKTLTIPAFLSALSDGYNIGVATTTLDSAGARVFASFTHGGGMGLDEMTGSPNLTIVAGIESGSPLPPPSDEPYLAERPMLPKSLPEALDALEAESLFRHALGETFVDYFIKLKRSEADRYSRSLKEAGVAPSDEPSEWEHNEYFDFF
jgi:glutamine synthetase